MTLPALIHHIRTQDTAPDHMLLGLVGSIACAMITVGAGVVFGWGEWGTLAAALLAGFLGGYATGALIELVQMWQRRGDVQNSRREQILDVLMTGSWWLWYVR